MLGPLGYNLSLRDSALVILFFNILSTTIPGYLSTLGPKTGMRQMIQARYSFGYVYFLSRQRIAIGTSPYTQCASG